MKHSMERSRNLGLGIIATVLIGAGFLVTQGSLQSQVLWGAGIFVFGLLGVPYAYALGMSEVMQVLGEGLETITKGTRGLVLLAILLAFPILGPLLILILGTLGVATALMAVVIGVGAFVVAWFG